MNKKIKKQLIFIILSLLLISLTKISYAATFTPGISATNVKVGDTITITVKADNAAGMYNVKVGDSSILEVTSGSTSEFLENNSAIIKLKAKKEGTTTISVTPSDMTDLDDSTKPVATGGKTYTVKVTEVKTSTEDKDTTDKGTTTDKDSTANKPATDKKEETSNNKKEEVTQEQPKEKSNNAYLKTLGVRISDSLAKELGVKTNEYDFSGFSKDKTSYNVTVPKNVDSLKVVATAGENGTVKVTGNSGFEVGSNNKITIKVTSENGKTTKTYTIKVTQLAEEEEKPGNVIEDEKSLYLTSLKIDGTELVPEFTKGTYSYTATISSDKSEVAIKAVANNEKAKVEISGNKDLIEGENIVNILLTLDSSEEQTVYQIVVTKEEAPIINNTDDSEEGITSTTDLIGSVKKYIGIAITIFAFIIIAIIVLIILLRKENQKIEEENDEISQPKNKEYNEYKNDENEFENNDFQKDNFIESLYRQRNGTLDEEDLTENEKETLEEINKQTEEIFREKVEGQSIEYSSSDQISQENPLEVRRKRRGKGKHSI